MASPVSFSCLVRVNWTPSSALMQRYPGLTFIQVSANDQGWVTGQKDEWSYISMKHINPARDGWMSKVGWVPTEIIQKGSPPGRIDIRHAQLKPRTDGHAPAPLANDNTLQKVLKALWHTIKASPDQAVREADRSNASITKIMFGEGINHYASIIYRNIVPKAVEIMKNGQFDPSDLVQQMDGVNEVTHSPDAVFGIYLYFFKDISDNVATVLNQNDPPRDALYGGQTMDYGKREQSHEARFRKPKGSGDPNLYRIGRAARHRKMVPFIVFRHDDPEVARYGKTVILEAAELTAPGIEYEYAWNYSRLIQHIQTMHPWRPKPTVGLNWFTPALCQMSRERQWLSYYSWERSAYVYRFRHPVSIRPDKGSYGIDWRTRHCTVFFSTQVQNAAQLKHRELATLQVELAHDGQNYVDHPVPWIRVPTPCHNREFEKLRSMAVSLQWFDSATNKWRSAAIQWTHARKGSGSDHEFSGLIQGMLLLSALTQTSYRNAPAWSIPLDRTTVRSLKYDHLRQQAWLSATSNSGVVKDWPRDSTFAENEQQILRNIPANFRNVVTIGAKLPRMGQSRKNCDLCISMGHGIACGHDPGTRSCSICIRYNRPCTWTNIANVKELLKTGGPLEKLGIPTHVQSVQDTLDKKAGRPLQSIFVDMNDVPFTLDIEQKLHEERSQHQEEDEEL